MSTLRGGSAAADARRLAQWRTTRASTRAAPCASRSRIHGHQLAEHATSSSQSQSLLKHSSTRTELALNYDARSISRAVYSKRTSGARPSATTTTPLTPSQPRRASAA